MVYYIILGRGSSGPHTIDELRQMHISATTPVWKEDLLDWVSASQLPELQGFISTFFYESREEKFISSPERKI